MKQIVIVIFCLIVLIGCASSGRASRYPQLHNSQVVSKTLQTQAKIWHGTPYQLGGTSRQGIDCSAFVQQTFSEKFAIQVPRSTKAQTTAGFKIKRSQLKPGDLLFFKTNWGGDNLHVGIYSGNDQFIHASTSQGVTTSSLNNQYWQKHFYQARRL